MFHLGICYEFGVGTPEDQDSAAEWYSKGSENGDAFAMERLGYYYSEGPKADPELSMEWFLRSAMEGIPTAMMMVGYYYLNGIGTERDTSEARKWLMMAADNGVEEAVTMLEELE